GVNSQARDGGQAAFVVVTNPPDPGAYSGFGLYYGFTNDWALPGDPDRWVNYAFSYDFKETGGHACVLEMQIKSGDSNWIQFTPPHRPGLDGREACPAILREFVQPPDVGLFDPNHVQGIAVNIRMLETGTVYVGLFDNIYFDAPDQLLPGGAIYSTFTSAN